jgi:CRISPR/Cas system-associated exonuclease Cas4 (RecB family)
MTTSVASQAPPSVMSSRVNLPVTTDQLLQTVSASRLQCWLGCRLKFFFRYVLKLQKPPTGPLHFGKVVHAILQQWNWARWRKEPFVIEQFKTFFDAQWQEQQADTVIRWDGEEEKQKTSAWSALQVFFMETPIKADEKPEAVEVKVETELPGLPKLVGVIDLVRAGGRIVDFKTSGKTPDSELAEHQHEIQTSAYALLYRDATGRKENGIELHHLVKTKQPKLIVTELGPMRDGQETRLLRLIESYVEGVERKDFVPSPGFQCAGCEYFNECRNWSGML